MSRLRRLRSATSSY